MEQLGASQRGRAALESPRTRPVAYVTFALNYRFGHYDVVGYRAVNLLLHALNGVLVYLLARALLGLSGVTGVRLGLGALFAALLFTAHPLQAVTYIVQRMTILCVFFYLSAILLWLRGRTLPAGWARALCWMGAAVAWGLALGSKEIAVTLPIALIAIEAYFFRGEGTEGRRSWRIAALAAGSTLALVALAFLYLGRDPFSVLLYDYERYDFGPVERALTEARIVFFYLGLWLWPQPDRFNLLHEFSISRSLLDPPSTALAFAGLAALAVLTLWLARRDRIASFALFWIGLHLALESSVIPLHLAFEHRLYLPLFGFSLLAADVLLRLAPRVRVVHIAAALGVVALLGVATHARNETWRDELELWSDVVRKSPGNAVAQLNLARTMFTRGQVDESVGHYRAAIRADPKLARAYNGLGLSLARLGRPKEARRQYGEALRLEPDYAKAHNNLGVTLIRLGDVAGAVHHFAEAVRIDPNYGNARASLMRAREMLRSEAGRTSVK